MELARGADGAGARAPADCSSRPPCRCSHRTGTCPRGRWRGAWEQRSRLCLRLRGSPRGSQRQRRNCQRWDRCTRRGSTCTTTARALGLWRCWLRKTGGAEGGSFRVSSGGGRSCSQREGDRPECAVRWIIVASGRGSLAALANPSFRSRRNCSTEGTLLTRGRAAAEAPLAESYAGAGEGTERSWQISLRETHAACLPINARDWHLLIALGPP